jgi:hypothetical protein
LLGLDVECCDKLSRKFLCDVGDAFPGVFFDVGAIESLAAAVAACA